MEIESNNINLGEYEPISDDTLKEAINSPKKMHKLLLSCFESFFQSYYTKYSQRVADAVAENYDMSVQIDADDVLEFDPKVYGLLVNFPDIALDTLRQSLAYLSQVETLDATETSRFEILSANLTEQEPKILTPSIVKLSEADHVHIRHLATLKVGRLVTVTGVVTRAAKSIPEMYRAFYTCQNCQEGSSVEIYGGVGAKLDQCPRCKSSGEFLVLDHSMCSFIDKRILNLQENPADLSAGETPVSLQVVLKNKQAPRSGAKVKITGVLNVISRRVSRNSSAMSSVYQTYLNCSSIVEISEETDREYIKLAVHDLVNEAKADPVYFRDRLVRSFAPSIYEHNDVKLGLLLSLFGGISKIATNGSRVRGEIHSLLIGDPGTAKSQLLSVLDKIAPHSTMASGKSSSAAGLTAAVINDPVTGEFVLEPGALVLADGGIACIDELDKAHGSVRVLLHEVLESQTVSIAKAGIITTLNARCSVAAAANPIKSRWDHSLNVIQNLNLPPSLISRFDLIFLVLDSNNPEFDRKLAKHIIALYSNLSIDIDEEESDIIPPDVLQAYVKLAKTNKPKINNEAANALIDAYCQKRESGNTFNVIAALPRTLEALIRISEALARMEMADQVTLRHVNDAVSIYDEAMRKSATDSDTGRLNLSLLNSVKSPVELARIEQLKVQISQAISAHLQDARSSGSSSLMSAQTLIDKLREHYRRDITQTQVYEVLDEMERLGSISLRRNRNFITSIEPLNLI